MNMLPLDDPRWKELDHRGWTEGARYHLDPDAPYVADELAQLLKNPADAERFSNLWPWLCSEGTAWPAAYATVPYAVELARRLPPEERFEYLVFVGLVVTCSSSNLGGCGPETYLAEGYQQALAEALPLLAETLVCPHDSMGTRYLLAAAAALKGHPKLADVLENLDCICGRCPRCGEDVWPEALQEALN